MGFLRFNHKSFSASALPIISISSLCPHVVNNNNNNNVVNDNDKKNCLCAQEEMANEEFFFLYQIVMQHILCTQNDLKLKRSKSPAWT